MMLQAGLYDLFLDSSLVISVQHLQDVPKTEPRAFEMLQHYLGERKLQARTYVDDNEKIIHAAVRSSAIPTLYHLDRKLGLPAPENKEGYISIGSLRQMNELHQNH